jgi:hypothetical protein
MLANPGGTFMYAVWNQWQEEILPDGEEHIFDSDMIFRRLMYLPDGTDTSSWAPTAYIAYQSASTVLLGADEVVTFVGGVRDWSGAGIKTYLWRNGDTGKVVGSERKFELPANALLKGKHTFYFSAEDNNSRWSREVPAVIEVLDPQEPETPVVPVVPVVPDEPSGPRMLFIPIIGH